MESNTGFSSEIGTNLSDWAIGQAGGSCYSRAALCSNDSKTRYIPFRLAAAEQPVKSYPANISALFKYHEEAVFNQNQ